MSANLYRVTLPLRAINQEWQINYLSTDSKQLRLIVSPGGQQILSLLGNVSVPKKNHALLQRWLKAMAKQHLIPWVHKLSMLHQLQINNVTIRSQHTIWASCSQDKNISLNYKLLFLPPDYAQHVMLHELCHTKHLNHSKRFWNLLEKLDPNTATHRKSIRTAEHYVPAEFAAKTYVRSSLVELHKT